MVGVRKKRFGVHLTRLAAALAAVTVIVSGAVVGGPQGMAAAAAAGTGSGTVQTVEEAGIAKSADLSKFQPGHIISDAVFFNKGTMTEAQIQTFLEQRVPRCDAGYTCLKDWYDTSRTTSADAMCGAYSGGVRERASRIIYKVAQACGINPQVILVTLQKEQGLVTHNWPSDWRYTIAMGQGCPDTAACDTRYYGFFNQVYGAAWQMKRYANPPGTSQYFTWYAPGKTWNVLYNPNRNCGSSPVFVQNQATANLYYYTPYQPNAAALRAGYAEGDGCSSYGNRNFFNYFTDWFGSTTYTMRPAIETEWKRLGGYDGPFGSPMGEEQRVAANGGGYVQNFQRGTIWWKTGDSRAYAMGTGPLRSNYLTQGGPAGAWGWPAGDARCGMVDGGCLMLFQHGTVGHSAATGSHLIPAQIAAEWNRVGAVVLGYPTASGRCGLPDGGCLQAFQKATVSFSTGTGAVLVPPTIAAHWNTIGIAVVGYPAQAATEVPDNGGGVSQAFTRGSIWSSAAGAFHMGTGPFRNNYIASGGPAGPWGWPAGPARCGLIDGGCLMPFQHGTVGYSAATGSILVHPNIANEWNRVGAATLGYPKSSVSTLAANGGGQIQEFTRGTVLASPAGSTTMLDSPYTDAFFAAGGPSGQWGWPTGTPRCGLIDQGCLQTAQHGTIAYSPATGVQFLPPAIAAEWNRLGAVTLGYPRSAPQRVTAHGGGDVQEFTKGTVLASPSGTVTMTPGEYTSAFFAAGGPSGTWGWPVAAARCGLVQQGCLQVTQNGTIGYSPSTGLRSIPPAIAAEWNRVGAVSAGYPLADAVTSGTVTTQRFERLVLQHDAGAR